MPGSVWRSGTAPLSRSSWTVFPGKTIQAQGRVGAKALRAITVRGRTRRLLWPRGNEWGREQEVNQSSGSRPVHVGPLNQCSQLGWFGPHSRGHLTTSADISGCHSCGVLLVSHWTPGSKDVFSIHSVQSDSSRKYPNPVSMVPRQRNPALFIYLAVPGLHCGVRILRCSTCDLVPRPGSNLLPLHRKRRVLATGPPGKSQNLALNHGDAFGFHSKCDGMASQSFKQRKGMNWLWFWKGQFRYCVVNHALNNE